MSHGTIIILNGTSSSGKTTLLKELQKIYAEPFLDAGLDRFLWMLPSRYLDRPLWDEVLGLATQAGSTGKTLISGMHHAIAHLAQTGNNVIADHVLVEQIWAAECTRLFSELPAYLIGVRCPLAVVEERERARKDRTLGQAKAQFELVHSYCLYDLEVDTSTLRPQACATKIQEYLKTQSPKAFKQMAAWS